MECNCISVILWLYKDKLHTETKLIINLLLMFKTPPNNTRNVSAVEKSAGRNNQNMTEPHPVDTLTQA